MPKIKDGEQQITVTLPKSYIEKLDRQAGDEMRSRSKQAAKILIETLDRHA